MIEEKTCMTCRFYEMRVRDAYGKEKPYCSEFCRWIGFTGSCGEWMKKEEPNGTRND